MGKPSVPQGACELGTPCPRPLPSTSSGNGRGQGCLSLSKAARVGHSQQKVIRNGLITMPESPETTLDTAHAAEFYPNKFLLDVHGRKSNASPQRGEVGRGACYIAASFTTPIGLLYVGIELSSEYIELARERIATIPMTLFSDTAFVTKSKRDAPRVRFGQLIESRYLRVGQRVFSKDRRVTAIIKADAQLIWHDQTGSMHRIAALAQNKPTFNGWEYWYCDDQNGVLTSIDGLREQYRVENSIG